MRKSRVPHLSSFAPLTHQRAANIDMHENCSFTRFNFQLKRHQTLHSLVPHLSFSFHVLLTPGARATALRTAPIPLLFCHGGKRKGLRSAHVLNHMFSSNGIIYILPITQPACIWYVIGNYNKHREIE